MKKLVFAMVILSISVELKAQINVEEVALVQSVYGMEKKDLIAKHMKLEASQSATFWKLYDEYEIERKEIGMKRALNIETYAKKYEHLSGEDAENILKTSFEVQTEFIKLWDKTYKKMAKEISPISATQFIQAEMFIENMVRQELSMEIPLIGEFDIKK